MGRSSEHPLPSWPNLMDTPTAASYFSLSEASFRAVAARHNIQPVEMGLSVTRWRKHDLDQLSDRFPARGGVANDAEPKATEDLVKDALENVRRQLKG